MKKVLYTCITGNYDELLDHQYIHPEWDYICFSNTIKPSDKNKSWTILPLQYEAKDDARTNRWHKINPHLCLKKYEQSIYMDANIDVISNQFFKEVEKQAKAGYTFALMQHYDRDCVYDEAVVCASLKLDDPKVIKEQIGIFKKYKYPKHNGLFASSFLYRSHMDLEIIKIMDEWWHWVDKHSRRDQLSLPYVVWKNNYKPGILPFKYFDNESGALYFWPHNKDLRELVKVLNHQIEVLNTENHTLLEQIDTLRQASLVSKSVRLIRASVNRIMKRS
jgi:hypothetical protein